MFTGIIKEIGKVVGVKRSTRSMKLALHVVFGKYVSVGESVAVDGVCLTVESNESDVLSFDVIDETLLLSTLGALELGNVVNIEYSLKLGEVLSGHIVYGHVDFVATLIDVHVDRYRFSLNDDLKKYVALKGSITVNGVSLTVSNVGSDNFEVCLIPETLRCTTLGLLKPGFLVNVETDIIAKYVVNSLSV